MPQKCLFKSMWLHVPLNIGTHIWRIRRSSGGKKMHLSVCHQMLEITFFLKKKEHVASYGPKQALTSGAFFFLVFFLGSSGTCPFVRRSSSVVGRGLITAHRHASIFKNLWLHMHLNRHSYTRIYMGRFYWARTH